MKAKKRLKNPKAKGNRRERQSIALLEKQGYYCCKSGGSLGAWDIVAVGPSDVLLVQVKSSRKPRPAEMKTLRTFATGPFCHKQLWIWHDRVKEPEIINLLPHEDLEAEITDGDLVAVLKKEAPEWSQMP